MKGNRLIECPVCHKLFQSLGYARHRTMHYERKLEERRQDQIKKQEASND